MIITPLPHLPIPAGATTDSYWSAPDCDGATMRSLEWSRHDTDKIGVAVDGWQDATGEVTRCVSLYDTDCEELTADDPRALAVAITEAVDELDRLAGTV